MKPEQLLYTKEHEWLYIDDNTATIGITEFAQGELGDIIFVEFPDLDQEIIKDDPFGTIEAVKTVADLFAPLTGKIIAINDQLEDQPELINTDPYTDGWIVKIEITNPDEKKELMDYHSYQELIN